MHVGDVAPPSSPRVSRVSRVSPVVQAAVFVGLIPLLVLLWTSMSYLDVSNFSVDVKPTYVAAKLLLRGESEAVYHPHNWVSAKTAHPLWQAEVQRLGEPLENTSFVYNPVYLWAATPLAAWLTLSQFISLVLLLNVAFVIVLGFQVSGLVGIADFTERVLLTVLVAASFPVAYAVTLGQNIVPALALILVGFRSMSQPGARRAVGIASLLAAVACKPWLVLVLPVVGLVHGLRAFGMVAAAYGTVFVVVPYAFAPALMAAHHQVIANMTDALIVAGNNLSARALLTRLAHPEWLSVFARWFYAGTPPEIRSLELLIVVPLSAAFAWALWRTRRTATLEAQLASTLCIMLITLSVCWSHYLVMTIPAAALALLGRSDRWHTAVRAVGVMQLGVLFTRWYMRPIGPLPYVDPLFEHPTLAAWLYAVPLSAAMLTGFVILLAGATAARPTASIDGALTR